MIFVALFVSAGLKGNVHRLQYQQNGRNIVRCVTSPVNQTSIAFHTKMGFSIEEGDKTIDGVYVNTDYDGPHQDRVLFEKHLM
jgi:predicted GNAT superfamily acetyltransferase